MSLYLCDPDKNKQCRKTACYGNGGPCFMTTDEAVSAGGNELNDQEIDAMERMLNMRLKLEQKRLQRRLRRQRQREEADV
ncbi:MAG: hypothetical protein J6Y26_05975 [Lachnospiraceae bacterium]|nr:hypothetical protein [Lachnospiraceae bacterium]